MKKYIPILTLVSLSVIAFYYEFHNYIDFSNLSAHQAEIELYIKENFLLSIFIYILFYILAVTLSMPGTLFIAIAGGFLFGMLGVFGAITGATIGACILFASTKLAIPDLSKMRAGRIIINMQKGFQEDALLYLLTLRIVPIFPFFAVNIASAIFKIPFKTFFLGTFFGIIPGAIIYVSIGRAFNISTKQIDSSNIMAQPEIIFAFAGLLILGTLPMIYKYFQTRGVNEKTRK